MNTELITPQEVAARYKMTPESLANWRREGKGPKYIKLGTTKRPRVMYRLADVLDWELSNITG